MPTNPKLSAHKFKTKKREGQKLFHGHYIQDITKVTTIGNLR